MPTGCGFFGIFFVEIFLWNAMVFFGVKIIAFARNYQFFQIKLLCSIISNCIPFLQQMTVDQCGIWHLQGNPLICPSSLCLHHFNKKTPFTKKMFCFLLKKPALREKKTPHLRKIRKMVTIKLFTESKEGVHLICEKNDKRKWVMSKILGILACPLQRTTQTNVFCFILVVFKSDLLQGSSKSN